MKGLARRRPRESSLAKVELAAQAPLRVESSRGRHLESPRLLGHELCGEAAASSVLYLVRCSLLVGLVCGVPPQAAMRLACADCLNWSSIIELQAPENR